MGEEHRRDEHETRAERYKHFHHHPDNPPQQCAPTNIVPPIPPTPVTPLPPTNIVPPMPVGPFPGTNIPPSLPEPPQPPPPVLILAPLPTNVPPLTPTQPQPPPAILNPPPLATLISTTTSVPYGQERILVKPRRATGAAAMANFHAARGAKVLRNFERMGGLQIINVPAGETVPGLIAKYAQSGLVEFAEPDYTVQIAATFPNDPYFANGLLWGLYNFGQNGGTPHADIDAIDAWDVLTSASNIVVAVLDTGVLSTHEDLAPNMWVNPVDGGHGFNALAPTNAPDDDNGHGTLVSGVLGARGNNGLGVTGVAWQVQLMECKCLGSDGTGTNSDIITCLDYAISNGAKIINASFSGNSNSLAMSNAIVSAQQAGIIFVAAPGNGGNGVVVKNVDITPTYPACYDIDNIVTVEYSTRNDTLGTLSNYGATNVDLAAPGDVVYSTFTSSDSSYFPATNAVFAIAGTSFSTPMVSGAFALMLAKYPTENYHQIISRLLNATDRIPALAGKCVTGGRLNLRKALSPPLILTAASATNKPFKIHLDAGPRRSCVILGSTNFQSWTPIYTNTTADDGTFDFSDPASTNSAVRYYRAQSAL